MSICFERFVPDKKFCIFFMGLTGLWLVFHLGGVQAQENALRDSGRGDVVASRIAANDRLGLSFCGLMISQANPLELKSDSQSCSKNNNLSLSKSAIRKIRVVLTAYSSTVEQTDSTPFITANGTYVHDGVVANNGLPFGTQIRIPELFGEKVFSVEDRMHWRIGDYQFDIWFPTYEQAKNFGVRYAYVEVLER